jgi:hypothetical protein
MLTLEQCARRAATRRNNKLKNKLPLLAEQWATTPEVEAERVVRQRAAAQEHLARLAQSDAEEWHIGEQRRLIAAKILAPEKWQHHADLWERTHPYAKPETHGFHLADWWWQALKGTSWAFQHCPNRTRHGDPTWWEPHWHFLLEQFVDTVECPTCGMPRTTPSLEEGK